VELDPHTPHHWHHLGRVRLARKDPLGALVAFTRAAQLYPIKIEYRQDRDAVAATLAGSKESR
jgi:cytochrome c-type biogenesis protein CcmH/NrfG